MTTSEHPATPPLEMRDAFNGTIVSSAMCAACELGLLDELHARIGVEPAQFARQHGLDEQVVRAIVATLVFADVMAYDGEAADKVVPGPQFAEAWRQKGYFLWLIGGYGTMLSKAAALGRQLGSGVNEFERDGDSIARAAGDYGAQFVDETFTRVVAGLRFERAADLGCGDASRLIRLCRSNSVSTCVGIEVDERAASAARINIDKAGLSDRIEIVHADAETLPPDGFPDVELVFSFFMGHDFWPAARCGAALARIRNAFPDVSSFLLADTYASDGRHLPSTPIFTLGFELTHALMGQHVPTYEQWLSVIAASEWTLAETHRLGIPNSVIFDLRPAA